MSAALADQMQSAQTTLYGINTCDSCRKARRWLDERGVSYLFHDLRQDGLNASLLESWAGALGWDALLNRQSTTWRQLPAEEKDDLEPSRICRLLLAYPTLIKRPLLAHGDVLQQGFRPEIYANLFA